MPQRFNRSILDESNKQALFSLLQSITTELEQARSDVARLKQSANRESLTINDLLAIKYALEAGGSAQLDVTSLIGILAQSQRGFAVVAPTLAALPSPSLYEVGTLGVVEGPPVKIYYVDEGMPRAWVDTTISSTGPANMMTTDTPQTVDAAAIKTVNAPWVFAVDQSFGEDVLIAGAANEVPKIKLTEADVAAAGAVQIVDGILYLTSNAEFDGTDWNRQDITRQAWRIAINTSNQLRFGFAAAAANPIAAWTDTVIWSSGGTLTHVGAATFSSTVNISNLLTLTRAAQALLLSGNAAANVKMLEIAPGGTSVFSVDREGDVLANSLALVAALTVGTTLVVTGTSTLAAATLSGLLTAPSASFASGAAAISSAGVYDSTGQFGANAYATGAQSLTNATITAIDLAAEAHDQGGCHDNATNNSRITVPTGGGGLWLVVGQIAFAANAVGVREAYIAGNGGNILARSKNNAPSATELTILTVVALRSAVDADYFQVQGYQTSGGALNTDATNASYTWMAAHKLC